MRNRKTEIIRVIKNRRSVREFNKKNIPTSILNTIIDAARWAPCPNNYQPWKFFIAKKGSKTTNSVIRYLEKKVKIRGIAVSIFLKDAIKVLSSASAVIYVFNTGIIKNRYKKIVSRYYQKKATLFEHQSISAAIENLILCAESFRLGTAWLGSPVMVNKGIERIFRTNFELNAIIAIGYYDKKPSRTKRLPVDEIVTFV